MSRTSLPACLASLLFTTATPAAAAATDLAAALRAATGQRAPWVHRIERPITAFEHPDKVLGQEDDTLSATPDMLLSLGGARRALVIREINVHPAHNSQGAYSIAYLDETASGWTLERFWPELTFAGVSGAPGNAGEEVRRYGADPLLFATDRWCGMGQCSDSIVVTDLAPSGPIFLESVLGGAVFPYDATDDDPDLDSDCPTCAAKARIGPPHIGSGLFSVTYEGWTAPPHHLTPRSWFRSTTDYVLGGHALHMSPTIKVPDCAR